MKALETNPKISDSINVYLIGNNPVELGAVYDKLKAIKSRTFNAEIDFDLKNIFSKIARYNPACILIDDNLEKLKLKKLIKRLSRHNSTKNIPITILKNSNYKEASIEEAQEYILKESITSDRLSITILNSIKLKRMQTYLYKTYRKRKSQFLGFLNQD